MRESWALAAVAVVTFMASLGALVPVFADLAGQPLAGWKRGRRILVVIALLVVSSVTGLAAYRATLAPPPKPEPKPAPADESTSVEPEPPVTHSATITATTSTIAPPPPGPRPSRPRIDITDGRGRTVSQLVAVAQSLAPKGMIVEGSLAEVSEQSEELQGMFTVFMTLEITVRRSGSIVKAFTVESKGGGFRAEQARNQALQRLTAAFEKRLAQEMP